jgi:hypothetical protein
VAGRYLAARPATGDDRGCSKHALDPDWTPLGVDGTRVMAHLGGALPADALLECSCG